MRSVLATILVLIIDILGYPSATLGQIKGAGFGPETTHGTVDIVLANKQGIVAVTDSMLSSNGRPVGTGQKLFKIDDHTLCTLAGWYSDSGPSVDQANFPLNTVLARVIKTYVERANAPGDSVERKAQRISDWLKFTLTVVTRANLAVGRPLSHEDSRLTIASYESGKLIILRIDLTNQGDNSGAWRQVNHEPQIVAESLVCAVTGIPDVAEDLLQSKVHAATDDPTMVMFQAEMAKNKGAALSLEQLVNVAQRLATLTALKYPNVVGPPLETGVIEGGLVTRYEPVPTDSFTGAIIPGRLTMIDGMPHAVGSRWYPRPSTGGLLVRTGAAVIAFDLDFTFMVQPLANTVIFQSKFNDCDFVYDGTNNFILDQSNTIINSQLDLTGQATPDSPMVLQLLRTFPGLTLVKNADNAEKK